MEPLGRAKCRRSSRFTAARTLETPRGFSVSRSLGIWGALEVVSSLKMWRTGLHETHVLSSMKQ